MVQLKMLFNFFTADGVWNGGSLVTNIQRCSLVLRPGIVAYSNLLDQLKFIAWNMTASLSISKDLSFVVSQLLTGQPWNTPFPMPTCQSGSLNLFVQNKTRFVPRTVVWSEYSEYKFKNLKNEIKKLQIKSTN